jgi:hypothetical protein
VGSAIESVLNSTFDDLELIVVDDGSSDRSLEVIKSYTDPRLRLFPQENRGAHAAMNRGVSLARSPWIAILNSDDVYDSDKLLTHMRLHRDHGEFEASISRVRLISETNQPLGDGCGEMARWCEWYETSGKRLAERLGSLFKSLFATNHLLTSSGLFMDRKVFAEIGGFASLRFTHDWFMFLTLAARGRFHVIEEALVSYRRHDANTINEDWDKAALEATAILQWHLFQALSANPHAINPLETFDILAMNETFCCEAALLLQFFCRDGDRGMEESSRILSDPHGPLLLTALELVKRHKQRRNFPVDLESCKIQLHSCQAHLEALLNSRSWRLTAPLRKLHDLIKRIQKKVFRVKHK